MILSSIIETLPRLWSVADKHPDNPEPLELIFDALRGLEGEDHCAAHAMNKNIRPQVTRGIKAASGVAAKERFFELMKKSLLFDSQEDFDAFLQYAEWNREPEKRFYLPRRKVLRGIVEDLTALARGDLDLLSLSLPPGTGKSTLGIFFLAWDMGNHPDQPSLASGHADKLTRGFYDGVLSIITDPEYLWSDVFPGVRLAGQNAKDESIDLGRPKRFKTLTCRSIDGSLTGATRCERILYADDLVSGIEEAMSKDRLDTLWGKYTDNLKNRKKEYAKELHIATRWSVHDVIGRLERHYEDDPRAKFVCIPAFSDAGETNFEYLYGVGFSTVYFLDMQNIMDDVSFRALFMNQPIEREGQLYNEDEMRRFYDTPESEPDAIVGICDTAEGGGDDTFLPVGEIYGDDVYLVDCVCDDGLPEVTDALCAEILIRRRVQLCQFESNAAGARTADKVQEKVRAARGRTRITKKRTTANKETKIIVNSSYVKEHFLFLDKSRIVKGSAYDKMLRKLCSYTVKGKNKHDDVPDGMAQLALFVQGLAGSRVKVFQRPF